MSLKEWLKKFLPPSSKTVNGRLDRIERMLTQGTSGNRVSEPDLFYLMCKANEIQATHHKTFLPYKGINAGRDIVVVGTGPTLSYYEPKPDAVHIGVNGAYHNKKIRVDYLFVQDFDDEGKDGVFYIEDIKKLSCCKFVGQYIKKVENVNMIAPQFVADYVGGKTYYVHDYMPGRINHYRIPLNLEFYPIVDNCSTIFAAMQFALYTRPRRIYIVGCDCSYILGQHFDQTKGAPMNTSRVAENWKRMKTYINDYYPDIEVISINPIGLKGLFEDTYTEEFERDHEDITSK